MTGHELTEDLEGWAGVVSTPGIRTWTGGVRVPMLGGAMSDAAPDEELMRRTAAGDEEAFRMLLRRHQDAVYGTAWKMLGAYHQDAEEVAQQVFLKVYRAAARYRPEAQFRTWLMTIVRNCVFTHRKRSARREGPLQPLIPEGFEEEGGEVRLADPAAEDPCQQLQQRELEGILQRAMEALPENQRTALVLRQYEQLDYEEIARVLKTTLPAVKSLLFRAREVLRRELEQYLRGKEHNF